MNSSYQFLEFTSKVSWSAIKAEGVSQLAPTVRLILAMKCVLLLLGTFVVVWGEYLPHQDDTEVDDRLLTIADREVAEIASEAYVYFYPIFVNTIALYFNSIWPHEPDYFGINVVSPINNGEILDWTFPAEHDSSAEQLYTRTWLDLERPVVFNIPSIVPQPRYYGMTFMDLYSINFEVVSPRVREGNWDADEYLIVGPGFSGTLPSRFDEDHIFRSRTRFTFIFGHFQVLGPNDLPIAQKLVSGFTITSLDGNEPLETDVPVFPFMRDEDIPYYTEDLTVPEPQIIFSDANFIINYMAIADFETDLFRKFAKIEVGPSKEFVGQNMSPREYENIRDGVADAVTKIYEAIEPDVIVDGWAAIYATQLVYDDNYLARAAAIKRIIFSTTNFPEECIYRTGFADSDGDILDSKYDYTLTYLPDQMPQVKEEYGGFWSVTAYTIAGVNKGAFIHNPIDRYVINIRTTHGLVYNDDGSLTMYIQKKRPDTDEKAANWLPTPDLEYSEFPDGGFHLIMRVYVPEPEYSDYFPPSLIKNGSPSH